VYDKILKNGQHFKKWSAFLLTCLTGFKLCCGW